MIYIIITVSYSIKRLFDYISWADPRIQSIEKSLDASPELNFKQNNFTYAISLTFDNETSLKNSFYEDLFIIQHAYMIAKVGEKKKKIISSSRNCKNSDFYNISSEYAIFKRQNISNFNCFDFYDNFTLKGIYTDPVMSYTEVLLRLNEKYIQNYTELLDIFNNYQFKFTLYYIDTFNDVSNFTKSVNYKVDAIYDYVDLGNFKRNNINFQEFKYFIDNKMFYNDYKNSTFMKLYSNQVILAPIQDRYSTKLDDSLNLNKFILRAVNNQKVVKLSFIKIPEFLASLSGLLVNLLVILAILMKTLNTFKAKQSIMSKIMKFKDIIKQNNQKSLDYLSKKFKDNNNSERSNSFQSLIFHKKENNEDSIISTFDIKVNSINERKISDINLKFNKDQIKFKKEMLINESEEDNYESSKKDIEKDKNSHIINLSDICCLLFCCKSIKKKQKIFQNAEEKFNYNIDLVTFMKKMQEVEILKYLLLDKDILKLMNFISKPCVSMSNKKIEDLEYKEFFENTENSNNISNENIDNVKNSYDNLVSKKQMSYTEERIIKLFNMQIQEIIQ